MSKRMTPKEKLLKAIFGTTEPTREQLEAAQEKLYEYQAKQVTDEDFQKMCGCSIQESVDRSMLFAGWCDTVVRWRQEHGNDRKYTVGDAEPEFTFRQVIDMIQTFYRQGQEDGRNGTSEYDRLWKINRGKSDAQDAK